jgi:glycerophosphoryl diester phosphodiesterase
MAVQVFADTPVLCGHRGAGRGVVGSERENTLGSFRAAVAAGLRWVEVDVRLTGDDVLVARHDPVLDDGRFIADLSAAETDAAGVMRVADLLAELPSHVAVDFDVKSGLEDALRPREATTGARLADLAAAEAARRDVLVTTFDPAALLIVRQRAPALPLGLLTWNRFPLRKAIAAAAHLGVDVVAPEVGSFPLRESRARRTERELTRCVDVAHRAGLQVAAWCPSPAESDELVAAGVDCLVIDDVPARV